MVRRLLNLFACEKGVNVAAVIRPLYSWFIGRRNFLSSEVLPVDIAEEWMSHDIAGIVVAASKTFLRIPFEQLGQNLLRFGTKVFFHWYLLLNNVLQHLIPIFLLVVRRTATKHFVKQRAKTPPVNFFVVPNTLNNFRGQVLGSAAERIGLFALFVCLDALLAKSKVGNFKISIAI